MSISIEMEPFIHPSENDGTIVSAKPPENTTGNNADDPLETMSTRKMQRSMLDYTEIIVNCFNVVIYDICIERKSYAIEKNTLDMDENEECICRHYLMLYFNRISNFSKFLEGLDDEHFGRAVEVWKENKIFAIHDFCNKASCSEDVSCLTDKLYLLDEYRLNTRGQTWLHCAVGNNCSEGLIRFIIEDLRVNRGIQDESGNTALHEFFIKVTKDNKDICQIIPLLMASPDDLLIENKNKETPLEVACRRKFLFVSLKMFVDLEELIGNVDVFKNYSEDIVREIVPDANTNSFWTYIFRENDESKLLAYMKNVGHFEKYYSMNNFEFWNTFKSCASDLGLKNQITQNVEEIINGKDKISPGQDELVNRHLAGIQIRIEYNKLCNFFRLEGVESSAFYGSAVFLALITGQWNLVMTLIAFSRLDVVPFCMLTCVVCDKMKRWKNISEATCRKIDNLNQSVDAYLQKIIDKMSEEYMRNEDHDIVWDYLTEPTHFFGGSLMDVGHFANCKRFLDSSGLKKVLSSLWKVRGDEYLSPFHKSILHSIYHIVFLLCLFSVLLMDHHKQIGGLEIFCYLYGIGYFVEEMRQMMRYIRMKQFIHYLSDATNVIDLIGLASFLIAFVLRYLISSDLTAYLFFSLTSVFLSVRLLYFLSVYKTFGPKLKMIERMIVIDLLPVMVIFFVFILPFGVSFQSLIFSGISNGTIANENNSSTGAGRIIHLLADILWHPTFTIFEPKHVIEEAAYSNNPSIQNPMMKLVVQFLLVMFIIIVSVMLMNMLIALFSHTVGEIMSTAEGSWESKGRWKFIQEYKRKPLLFPPLNIIEIAVNAIKALYGRHKQTKANQSNETAGVSAFTILFLLKIDRFKLLEDANKRENDRKCY